MINKVTLIGHLGKDPEVRTIESGASVATFSLATNESYKDKAGEWQTQTEWHNIVLWRDLADRIGNQAKKGNLIYIEGKLTTRKYQDKDGQDRYITEILGNTFRLLEKREGAGSFKAPLPTEEYHGAGSTTAQNSNGQDTAALASMPPEADDLPF